MKRKISSSSAIEILLREQPLVDVHIGELNLYKALGDRPDLNITIENCHIENLHAPTVDFQKPVRLIRTSFEKCQFYAAYFIAGLNIRECTFEANVDFEAGGHNKPGNPIHIENCQFKEFVNFFDCWFQGPVTIKNNIFEKGTNLLGNTEKAYGVQFDEPPEIKDNTGELNLDDD